MLDFKFEVGKRYKRKNIPNVKSFECVYTFKDGKEAIFKDDNDPLFPIEFHVANYTNTFEVDVPEVIHEVIIRENSKKSLILQTKEELEYKKDVMGVLVKNIPIHVLEKSKGFLYITTKGDEIVNVEFSKERRK